MSGNLSAPILARLLTFARQRGDDYNLLLDRIAIEPVVARVGTSAHAGRLLLKGRASHRAETCAQHPHSLFVKVLPRLRLPTGRVPMSIEEKTVTRASVGTD